MRLRREAICETERRFKLCALCRMGASYGVGFIAVFVYTAVAFEEGPTFLSFAFIFIAIGVFLYFSIMAVVVLLTPIRVFRPMGGWLFFHQCHHRGFYRDGAFRCRVSDRGDGSTRCARACALVALGAGPAFTPRPASERWTGRRECGASGHCQASRLTVLD